MAAAVVWLLRDHSLPNILFYCATALLRNQLLSNACLETPSSEGMVRTAPGAEASWRAVPGVGAEVLSPLCAAESPGRDWPGLRSSGFPGMGIPGNSVC